MLCRSSKRWDQELVRPDLDYHDFFHPEVGNEPGNTSIPFSQLNYNELPFDRDSNNDSGNDNIIISNSNSGTDNDNKDEDDNISNSSSDSSSETIWLRQ